MADEDVTLSKTVFEKKFNCWKSGNPVEKVD